MKEGKIPTVLVILDGWGIAPPSRGNAITLAKTPTLDRLFGLYPSGTVGATGKDVGLETNQMSGSEAGHINIGAGRVVIQDSYEITKNIKDGSFFINPILTNTTLHYKKYKGKFHVMGLMGDSDSPHSNPEHFRAILKLAKRNGVQEVFCHLFTDGRDSYPKSALIHLSNFRKIMIEEGIGKIASISGRFYAMDRAKNWDRLVKAFDAIVFARGEKATSAEEAIENGYKKGLTDEYILPTVIFENNHSVGKMSANDSVIFFNLRSDRARQFTKLFIANNKMGIIKDDMPVIDQVKNLHFTALTNFGPDLNIHTAYFDKPVAATLPMVLSHKKQMYISESEKYAHITYFFNGGYSEAVGGENRVTISSPIVNSYAEVPQMSAASITEKVKKSLNEEKYDFIALNYANADMVGHTGDLKATVKAVGFLDEQIKKIVKIVLKQKGNLIITADHGNADIMIDTKSDQPNTFHTKNPVPFLLVSDKFKKRKIYSAGVLGNIAPTILDILGIEKPRQMDKHSLLI